MHPAFQTIADFAVTRPVAWGAPAAAVLGLAFGGFFYIGPQTRDPMMPMMPMIANPYGLQTDTAVPIAWPGGKVPDYVIGTDFIAMTRPPAPIPVYEPVEPPPPPEPPTQVQAARQPQPAYDQPVHDPAAPRAYASAQGDILDIRLPEDRSPPPSEPPMVMAQALPAR